MISRGLAVAGAGAAGLAFGTALGVAGGSPKGHNAFEDTDGSLPKAISELAIGGAAFSLFGGVAGYASARGGIAAKQLPTAQVVTRSAAGAVGAGAFLVSAFVAAGLSDGSL